jgi:hypothetical protein
VNNVWTICHYLASRSLAAHFWLSRAAEFPATA